MSNVYGYLSADYQLPNDCRNEKTIVYFMRCSSFIRLIENRETGVIHWRILSTSYSVTADTAAAEKDRLEFEVPIKEGRHIDVLEKCINSIQDGDQIIFSSITDLSSDCQAAIYLYRKIMDNGISAEFLDQPWLNTRIYTRFRHEYPQISSLIQSVIEGVYKKLDENKEYIELLTGTESNKAKKNARKR